MRTLTNKIKMIIAFILIGGTCSADDGYFLNLQQKAQLIGLGLIEDSNGTWYDIWVCPGYKKPFLEGVDGIKQSVENLKEYSDPEKYSKLAKYSKECFDWTFTDCLGKYTMEGTTKAWPKYFKKAEIRTERRLFGWWLSYPYAFMQAGIESTWRLSTGILGTAGGVASGAVIIPTYYMTNSAIKAAWNGGVKGLILPASKIAWNTAISPVLAVFGQKPSESRVDGHWVSIVKDPSGKTLCNSDPLNESIRIIKDLK